MSTKEFRLLFRIFKMMAITCKQLIFTSTIFALAANALEITQLITDGDIMITTSETNFAIAEQSFLSMDIRTLTMNDRQVVMYSPTCQLTIKTTDELSSEVQNLLVTAKARLSEYQQFKIEFGTQGNGNTQEASPDGRINIGRNCTRTGRVEISNNDHNILVNNCDVKKLNSNACNVVVGKNIYKHVNGISLYSRNGNSIIKATEKSYSMTGDGMPDNLVRLFVHHDVVTFVYGDGSVQMKPENCLNSDEQRTLLRVRETAQLSRDQFKGEMGGVLKGMKSELKGLEELLASHAEYLDEARTSQIEAHKERLARKVEEFEAKLANL